MKETCIEDIQEMKKQYISWLKSYTNLGMESVDEKAAGEVADIVKDLCEAEKLVKESCYYEKVVEAMDSKDEEDWGKYGYRPYMNQKAYVDDYLNDPNFEKRMMGYHEEYEPYGTYYNKFKEARRHYTKTGATEDKNEMEMYSSEHLDNSLMTLRDIWKDASPALKVRMKSELTDLVSEMKTA